MTRAFWAVAAVLGAGAVWWAKAQSPEGRSAVWELATVESLQEVWIGNLKTGTANICFHTPNGCRWETIRITTDR